MQRRPVVALTLLALMAPTAVCAFATPGQQWRAVLVLPGDRPANPVPAPGLYRLRGPVLSRSSLAVRNYPTDATAASSPDRDVSAGVPAEDAVRPAVRLKMHDLEKIGRVYEIIVTAFACTMALYFLNVWASLCVFILRGGLLQQTPSVVAAVQRRVLSFVAGPNGHPRRGMEAKVAEVACAEPHQQERDAVPNPINRREMQCVSEDSDAGYAPIDKSHLQPHAGQEQQLPDAALEAENPNATEQARIQQYEWQDLAKDLAFIASHNAKAAVRSVVSNAANLSQALHVAHSNGR